MFYILSDTEVALNELLVACRASIDHYDAACGLIDDEDKITLFRSITNQRTDLSEQLAAAIRELGDLPSAPDPDKETSEILIEHLGASLSENDEDYIMSQRIKAEEHLQSLVDDARELESALSEPHRALLIDLSKHIDETIKALLLNQ